MLAELQPLTEMLDAAFEKAQGLLKDLNHYTYATSIENFFTQAVALCYGVNITQFDKTL